MTEPPDPRPRPVLLPGGFHVWEVPRSPADPDKLRERELARFARMTHPEARRDYAASQAGLREVLALYLDCPPEKVTLERRERGKPFLANGPEFNLSHSGGRMVLAVSLHPVGLDLEADDRRVRHEGLAAKFFSPAEQRRMAEAPSRERNRLFLRHWVGKEAAVKLSGEGIFLGLRAVEIHLEERGGLSGRYRGREVYFREFCPAPGFLAAVASWQPLEWQGRFSL